MSKKFLNQQSKQEVKKVQTGKKLIHKFFGAVIYLAPLPLMAAGEVSEFKTGLAAVMGFGALLAFVLCFYFLIMAIIHHRQGGDFGKDIIAVVMCAASGMICGAIFAAFKMGEAAIKPTFSCIITHFTSMC